MEIIKRSNLSYPPTTSIDDCIPDWLLFEILLRLPIKSVFKCRVVSKRWLSVASDPHFIGAYASRASSSSSWIVLPLVLYSGKKFLPMFVHDPSNNPITGELYLQPPPPRSILRGGEIIGVSDGLVLYSTYTRSLEFDDLYVCNPITGDRTEPVTLQFPSYHAHLGLGFLTRVDGEFTLKSYRIVQAMQNPDDPTVIIFKVYYSEIGNWSKFTVNGPVPYQLALQESAAVLDGILYWADTSSGGVIAYDPEAKPEHVRLIRDPHDSGERTYDALYSCACVAHRGELRYFGGYSSSYNGIPRFSIWKLDGSGEWRLVHKIKEEGSIMDITGIDIRLNAEELKIVCFDPFDSEVVYLSDGLYRLFSYDMKTGTLDDRRELIVDDNRPPSSLLTRSSKKAHVLVVPPWPAHVAVKHGG